MEKKEKRILIVLSIVIFCFVVILFSLLAVFLYLLLTEVEEEDNQSGPFLQYLEINQEKDHRYYAFVHLNRPLLKDELISYENPETGNPVFISNIGDNEYKCTGSCHCEQDFSLSNTRRQTSSLLSTGLVVLFSAVSTTVAFNIARETFHSNCVSGFADVCSAANVKSEVDECEEDEVGSLFADDNEDYSDIFDEIEKNKKNNIIEYMCDGHCEKNFALFDTKGENPDSLKYLYQSFREFGTCQRMEVFGTIKIDGKTDPSTWHPQAVSSFYATFLNQFCSEKSIFEWMKPLHMDGKEWFEKTTDPFCIADAEPKFSNISCKKKEYPDLTEEDLKEIGKKFDEHEEFSYTDGRKHEN